MRRQLSLDPLSARAERCVTERGARTGLEVCMAEITYITAIEISPSCKNDCENTFATIRHDATLNLSSIANFLLKFPAISMFFFSARAEKIENCEVALFNSVTTAREPLPLKAWPILRKAKLSDSFFVRVYVSFRMTTRSTVEHSNKHYNLDRQWTHPE